VFSLAVVQFLNVLQCKQQVVYHNRGLGLLLGKAEGGRMCTAGHAGICSGVLFSPELSCQGRSSSAIQLIGL
jgi:hypothetical protein